jgi:beta-lactamase class A
MMKIIPARFIVFFSTLTMCFLASLSGTETLETSDTPENRIAAIERRLGGRLGVLALDTGTGQRIKHRASERFPMCSTFKFLLAGTVLDRIDKHRETLDRRITYGETDLLEYAPIAKEHVKEGAMTVAALCAAAIEYSDNTAANLLLETIGGPSQLTAYLRSLGDKVTRLDRIEPDLNSGIPGDPRDTATPESMLHSTRALVLGEALSQNSRQQLQEWLIANTTGGKRLRAGLPMGWRVGDKTGTGKNGARNDVAVVWPFDRAPIVIVEFFIGSNAADPELEEAIAEVGRVVADSFGRPPTP